MTVDAGTAIIEVKGDFEGFGRGLRDQEGEVDRAGSRLGGILKAGVLGAAAGIGAGLVGAFALGSNFDDAFDTIRVNTGAMGAELEGLKEDWRGVVASVPTDFGTAAEAISTLNQRMELSGQPLQDLAGQFIQLANITGLDLPTAMDSGQRALEQWGIPAEEAGSALDRIFRATQETGVAFDVLSGLMTQFGPTLSQLGFGFDQSAALIGSFEEAGLNTSQILGGLTRGLTTFARAGEAPADALSRLVGEIRGMEDPAAATARAIEVFGRSGAGMADAIRSGVFDVDALTNAIANGEDTITGAAADTADFAEQWTLFKNRVLLAIEPLAMRVFDAVGKGFEKLAPYLERFSVFLNSVFEAFDSGGFSAAMNELGAGLESIWPTIRGLFDDLGAWIRDAGLPMLGDALVAGAHLLWEWLKDITPPALRQLGVWIEEMGRWLWSTGLPELGRLLGQGAELLWAWIQDATPPALRQLGVWLGELGAWVLNEGLPMLGGWLGEMGVALAAWIGPQIGPALAALGEFTIAAVEWLANEGLPLLAASLLEWGKAFVAWVGPQIPPLLAELVVLLGQIGQWMVTVALPEISAKLLEWAVAFGEWVLTEAAPRLLTALGGLLLKFGDWYVTDLWPSLIGWGATAAEKLLGFLADAAAAAPGKLWDLASAVGRWITDEGVGFFAGVGTRLGTALIDAIGDILSGTLDLASDIGRQFVNGIIGFINTQIVDKVNALLVFEIDPPGPGSISFNPPDIPRIPRLASGAVLNQPTVALLAETAAARPEIVTPERLMRQIVREEGGAGGAGTLYIERIELDGETLWRNVTARIEEHARADQRAVSAGVRW